MLEDPITEITIAMELNYFAAESRGVLRAGGDEDSRQRAQAGARAAAPPARASTSSARSRTSTASPSRTSATASRSG